MTGKRNKRQPDEVISARHGRSDLHLSILGNFALAGPNRTTIAISIKKSRALLAILALSPGQQATRQFIAALLWGDHSDKQARSNLRQTLAVLRRELGILENQILYTHDDIVELRLATVQIDANEFLSLSDAAEAKPLQRAAVLYRGQLLADTSIQSQIFEDWLSTERHRIADRAIAALEKLSALESGQAAIDVAKRLVGLDHMREASHRALMHAYSEAGEIALALQQFENCAAILKLEFAVEPAPATILLRNEISRSSHLRIPGAGRGQLPHLATGGFDLANRPSLVVLPLVDMSEAAKHEYFAAAVTEDIVTALCRFRTLLVVANTTLSVNRHRTETVFETSAGLGVKYVLEGSIRRSFDRVRISIRLIETASGSHLWAEQFDRGLEHLLQVQDEIASTVASTVSGKIEVVGKTRAKRLAEGNIDAYGFFLRAAAEKDKYTKESLRSARQLLHAAIAKDPGLGPAYQCLSYINFVEWMAFWTADREAMFASSVQLAADALAIDGDNSGFHAHFGMLQMYMGEYETAKYHFDKALELNASDSKALALYGFYLTATGRAKDAMDAFATSARFNPFQPDWINWLKGIACFTDHRYEEAILTFRTVKSPLNEVRGWLAASYGYLGQQEKATASLQAFLTQANLEMVHPPKNTAQAWMEYWRGSIPYRSKADIEHLFEGLRQAGLSG